MDSRMRPLRAACLLLCLWAGLAWQGAGSASIKLRVISDSSAIKATPEIGGTNLALIPLNTILDADPKQGEWYKVYYVREGVQMTGYIHEFLVTEISENEAQQPVSPSGFVKSQADIIADIQNALEEEKRAILRENEPDKVPDTLLPYVAKAFMIDDRTKQKQTACELFFWIGLAHAKKGDKYGALRNFRSMFDVDYQIGKDVTKNITERAISALIEQAEQLFKGTLVDYSLQISTTPKEAEIKVDGKSVGMSPIIYRSTVPQVTLEVIKEGYRPVKEDLFLAQATTQKDYALVSIGRNVTVSSQPTAARVFVDGKDTGQVTDCTLPFVPYGGRTIRLARASYSDWEGTIQVLEGEGAVPVSANLIAKDYVYFQKNGGPVSTFFKLPKALTFDKAGSLYIVDESTYKVKKFDPQGMFLPSWGEGGSQTKFLKVAAGIAVDAGGNAYVTDSKACCVAKFDANGKFVKKWGEQGENPGQLWNPAGIAVDEAGDLYVADMNNNRIVKFSADGAVKKIWGKAGSRPGEFVYPAAVAIGRKKELVVVDRARVQTFTLDGEPLAAWGKAGTGDGEIKVPSGVWRDLLDAIYIADTGNNRVLKFDATGKLISQWGSEGSGDGQMMAPVGVAVDGKGAVFVLERDNQRYQEFRIPAK